MRRRLRRLRPSRGLLLAASLASAGAALGIWTLLDSEPAPSSTPSAPALSSPSTRVSPGALLLDQAAPPVANEPGAEALCAGCDVLLVSFCSLRRDHVGAYGVHPGLTPSLDRVAEQGTRFDRAYAASNFTLASLTAILTGRFGSSTGVLGWDQGLGEGVSTLPEVLGYYGYTTAAFTIDAASGFRPDYGLHRGFQHMEIIPAPPDTPDGRRAGADPGPGGASARPVAEWIRAADPDARLFTMFHSRTAHFPFVIDQQGLAEDGTGVIEALWEAGRGRAAQGQAMPGSAGGTEQRGVVPIAGPDPVQETVRAAGEVGVAVWRQRYAEAVGRMDRDLAVVLDALEETGRLERTIVLVVADHGESLDEHGELLHGDSYYEGVVRVPLLLRVPGLRAVGSSDALISQVDLAPTLLELVGAVLPAGIDGRSAVGLLTGAQASIREVALVEGGVARQEHPTPRGAVIAPPWTLLRQDMQCSPAPRPPPGEPQTCLFDVDADPLQASDLAAGQASLVEELLQRWEGYRSARASEARQLDLDPAFVEQLQRSGYDFQPLEP